MLIKLYNGLNRFAPGPRLNFRYFSWVPDHRTARPAAIAMADLLPFFGPAPSFLVSRARLRSSVSRSRPLCSSPANPLILRDTHVRPIRRAGKPKLVDSFVARSRAHFCPLREFYVSPFDSPPSHCSFLPYRPRKCKNRNHADVTPEYFSGATGLITVQNNAESKLNRFI